MSRDTPWPFASPRTQPRPVTEAVNDRPAWARRGRWLRRPNGERVEVHPIGALAEALGKSSFTIRRWERDGVLPPTPLVLEVAGGPPRRLYSTQQIEGIAAVADEEGVAHRKPSDLAATNFTIHARSLYSKLFPEHFGAEARPADAATAASGGR